MGQSPGLRPLTLRERAGAWFYGLLPSSFIYMTLRLGVILLEVVNLSGFSLVTDPPTVYLPLPFTDYDLPQPLVDTQVILSRAFYPVAYFTWGRSTGHLLFGAYIVDRKTMRQIGPGRKLIRSLFQVVISPAYLVVDMMSVILVMVDREQRRSINDWVAGTLVVTGDVPLEPEPIPWRRWVGDLSQALRGRRPAAAPQG